MQRLDRAPTTHDFDLERFLTAQASVYNQVLEELRTGRKRTHWMWFIFPQIRGLGHSSTAQRFAIESLLEARDYLSHPILGQRLRECTELVNAIEDRSTSEIFGYPDDLKFHSSMTLFAHATKDNQQFRSALQKYFNGVGDALTLARL